MFKRWLLPILVSVALAGSAVASNQVSQNAQSTNSAGQLNVSVEGQKQSYCAGSTAFTGPAGAGVLAYIQGSGTKTIRVVRASISGTATAATTIDLVMVKRNTGYTGGTFTAMSVVPLDSNNIAATATVNTVATATTGGTLVGFVHLDKLSLPTSAGPAPPLTYTFSTENEQAVVLRGTGQSLEMNVSGVPAGFSGNLNFCWTEE